MPLESLLEDFGSVLVVLLRIFRNKHIILIELSGDLTVLHRKKRKKAMYARSNAFASQRPIFPVAILFVGYTGRYLHRGSLAIRLRRTRSTYRCKIRREVKCLTRPEIEMLVIIAEDCHDDFQKRRMKPSIYCKDVLGLPEVKTYGFFRSCFSDIDLLLKTIKRYVPRQSGWGDVAIRSAQ